MGWLDPFQLGLDLFTYTYFSRYSVKAVCGITCPFGPSKSETGHVHIAEALDAPFTTI